MSIAQKFGIETLRGAMATLLGVPIDRYIRVDMDDFAVDGRRGRRGRRRGQDASLRSQVNLFLEPGPAHLDGIGALSYSRTRADSGGLRTCGVASSR